MGNRISLLILLSLLVSYSSSLIASDCPKKRDLNGDCIVDINDLQVIGQYWLTNCSTPACDDIDLTGDGIINIEDFADFAREDWLDVGVPIEINEVLAHSHDIASDWIELYNPTDYNVNIGGWYLSDNNDTDADLMKYRIANNTIIPAHGYKVFYEATNFGNIKDAGCLTPFALSERGEDVYLSSATANVLTGYTEKVNFSGSDSGISFGRFYVPSRDKFDFVAMLQPTPGRANAAAKTGPLVINEVMYHALDPEKGDISDDDDDYDYIELYNNSASTLPLYVTSETQTTGWTISDAIEVTIPGTVFVPAYGYVVLVKDLDAFNERYTNTPASAIIIEWDSGKLNNSGETISLAMPGDFEIDQNGWYYIIQDEVKYSDESPWPDSADGDGDSLSRIYQAGKALYSKDPDSWQPTPPNPGQPNP